MKTNELNMNEMEQVNGGNFFADLEEVLRRIFQNPTKPDIPDRPISPNPVMGRGKC